MPTVDNDNSNLKPREQQLDTTDKYTILNFLNSYCLNHIFTYVSTEDLIRSERVSKLWRYAVTDYFGSHCKRVFDTSLFPGMTLHMLERLLRKRGAAFTELYIDDTKLDIGHEPVYFDGDFCPNLKYLKINARGCKSYFWQFLCCEKLKTICLISNDYEVADEFFVQRYINDDLSLERLTLKYDASPGLFLGENIHKFRNIKYLAFLNCNNLKINYVHNIRRLHNLTTLKMDGCSFNSLETILKILSSLTQLQELTLIGYSAWTENIIDMNRRQLCEALSKLFKLKHLNLSDNILVTNDVLKQIAQTCKLLKSLDVSYCKLVGDEGVTAVCVSCENLIYLNVTCLEDLSTHGLEAVSRAERLVTLEARGYRKPNITPSLAACLLACRALRELDASSCDVTSALVEAAVVALQRHPRRLELRLQNTVVTTIDELPKHRLLTVIA